MPQRQLVGFNRYYIKKDESIMFKFHINPEQLAVWTDRGWVVEPGNPLISIFPRMGSNRDAPPGKLDNTKTPFPGN